MSWISTLFLLTTCCLPNDGSETPASLATPEPAALSHHVVVVGASASEGFGLQAELEVPAPLALFLDAAWAEPQPLARNLASSRLFLDPVKAGARQRDAVLEGEVSLLVAVDFLFWFGYGIQADADERLATLELGLAMLDEIGGPMLVGDFPDMRPALQGEGMFGGPVISARQIPDPKTIARLNARLDEWSQRRPNVIRVPLAEFVTKLQKQQPLELRGMSWSAEDCARLLQSDLLHPTVEGTAALALLCMDALERAHEGLAADQVQWKVETVVAGVRAATEPQRAEAEAKRAAREERLRKLEERKRQRGSDKESEEPEESGAEREAA